MILACSKPENGFLSLFPQLNLGENIAVAMYRAGIRSNTQIVRAFGYGAVVTSHGHSIKLMSKTIEGARLECIKHACVSPVILVKAVAVGRFIIYEKVERIEISSQGSISGTPFRIIAKNGVLVQKEVDVYDKRDIRRLSKQLAGRLRKIDRELIRPHILKALEGLDKPWDEMSRSERNRAFSDVNKQMKKLSMTDILPLWTKELKTSLLVIGKKTRRQVIETFFPRIGASFSRDQTDAIEQIGVQNGWFLRDRQGAIDDALTAAGRKIVEDGLKKGLGRNEIGKMLKDGLPELWDKYGDNYANTVSAVAVVRARSFADMSTYADAGVEKLEVVAQLDERTTDVCRYMDGQTIDVGACLDLSQRASDVKKPEDIYKITPFMRIVETEEGKMLQTANGDDVARMVRSGVGVLNDRGEFRRRVSGNSLPGVGVGAPPYHFNCRTRTVPIIE